MTNDNRTRMPEQPVGLIPQQWWWVIVSLGVVCGLMAAAALDAWLSPKSADLVQALDTAAMPATPRPREAAKRLVEKHLAWAERQSATDLPLASIREFFEAAKHRTRPLAVSLLGWESKLALGKDYVLGGSEHAAFLATQFEEFLFTEAELDELIQQTIAGHLWQLKDVESEFLLKLEADLEALPADELPPAWDQVALRAVLQQALDQATTLAQREFQAAIGREVVSWLAGESLALIGTQLATSAGLIGAGAGSGWATFGVGVAVSLAADYAITQWYHHAYDPIGKLERMLDDSLDQLQGILIDGTDEQAGLARQLQEYTACRNAARRAAIQQAVLVP